MFANLCIGTKLKNEKDKNVVRYVNKLLLTNVWNVGELLPYLPIQNLIESRKVWNGTNEWKQK